MYTVEPYPEAEAAIVALAEAARNGYDDAVKVMQLVPWNGAALRRQQAGRVDAATHICPGGAGLVTYLILEDQQRVDVLQVAWAGE